MNIIVNPNQPRSYRVLSERSGNLYDVDLNALGRNGCCDCGNFIFRLEDKVQRGEIGLACSHIVAARKYERKGFKAVSRNAATAQRES